MTFTHANPRFSQHPAAITALFGRDGMLRWREVVNNYNRSPEPDPRAEFRYKHLLTDLFGDAFWCEITERLSEEKIFTLREAEVALNECLAYLLARSMMKCPNAPLACCRIPDEAWHLFAMYTFEYAALSLALCGTIIHHDPARSAFDMHDCQASDVTLRWFEECGIHYDPECWADHERFPAGVEVVRGGFVPL